MEERATSVGRRWPKEYRSLGTMYCRSVEWSLFFFFIREGKSRSQLPEFSGPWRCSTRPRCRRPRLLLLLRLRDWSQRRSPGTLGPTWTLLPPGLLVGGARENRPEPGTILTDRLLFLRPPASYACGAFLHVASFPPSARWL